MTVTGVQPRTVSAKRHERGDDRFYEIPADRGAVAVGYHDHRGHVSETVAAEMAHEDRRDVCRDEHRDAHQS